MSRAWCVIVAVAFIATATFVSPAAGSQAEVFGIELVAHPDQQQLGRRGQVSIVASAEAGTTVQRQVRVSNGTRETTEVEVYIGGARIAEEGFVPADGEGRVEDWGRVDPGRVELAPQETTVADVVIEVPADAPNGEHYGVVWLQPPASGGQVSQVNRVGIRIYLSVGGGVDEAVVDFTIDAMTASRLGDGRPVIELGVTNSGERAVDLVGEVELREGPGGSTAGPFSTVETTTVAIGGAGTVVVPLAAGLPEGPWTARAVLTSGETDRAAEATVTFPTRAGEAAEPVVAEMTPVERQRRVLIPLVGSLVGALLVISLVLLAGQRGGSRS